MRKITALCTVALLTLSACATPGAVPKTLTVTQTTYVPWTWPASLQTCQPDPAPLPIPHVSLQSDVAKYIVALRNHDQEAQATADDCRETLNLAIQANKGTH